MNKVKNGKRLTLNERKYLESLGLAVENWLITKKLADQWHLVHKLTGQEKIITAP